MRVVIVDNDAIYREGLHSLLSKQSGFEVVGLASTAREAAETVRALEPELVLMCINLPDASGLLVSEHIAHEHPGTLVVMLSDDASDEALFDAIRSGAQGMIVKGMPFDKILPSLRAVAHGEAAISRAMATRLVAEFRRLGRDALVAPKALGRLTARELQVLARLGAGGSNREIARDLIVSEHTIKVHVRSILAKLRLKSRVEAAALARHHGLVEPAAPAADRRH